MQITVQDATLKSEGFKHDINILCEVTYDEFNRAEGVNAFLILMGKLIKPAFGTRQGYDEIKKRMTPDHKLLLGFEQETGASKACIYNTKTGDLSTLEAEEKTKENPNSAV